MGGRLLYPFFGLAFAFLFVGSVWDVSVPGIVVCGGMAAWCFVLAFGSWRSRLVVDADEIRQVRLRGELPPIRWSDLTRVSYMVSTRYGAAVVLVAGMDADAKVVGVGQLNYSMRKVRRALRAGLREHRGHIVFDDPFGVLQAAVTAR